jgi:hypothetical protein
VTHTAEVEVKSASIKRSLFCVTEKGSHKDSAPNKITEAKLKTNILVGER